ncbi:MAG: PAS domain-containing sensor histidine kinase [Sphingomonadales bacterium]|nr:MAG: PAS domain-containing sensor histidine kinase [Sphingomonadales bacterium]
MNSETPDDLPGNRFELLVQSITDYAIYMLDVHGNVASWNPGAERFKGYAPAEIIGSHFSRFYSAADRDAGIPARALQTALADGRFEAEGWRIRKDGSRFWASVVIDPIRDAAGRHVGFAKITRDLSERRAAEEALRRSEERFRMLVQSVTDYAIYMLDTGGHVVSWNPGAQRFKGYSADEIVGAHFSRFYTDEDKATDLPARALATAGSEGRFEAEGWRLRKDGTCFWASVVIDPVRDDTGELVGFAKITRDLTERRDAQLALEQTQEAFFQAQKMEAVGKLTGGVAHDFNNLLAAVIGSLDLARRRMIAGGDASRFIDNAMKAAERGATLTQRMLAFARKQELKLGTVDLALLVRGMADLLERTIGGTILIETRFPLTLKPVHADAAQLELALLNLVVNARDAMPAGGTITISAREQRGEACECGLAAGAYICLCVTDEGEGMDADTLARAADPFFTTKGIGKGTGLGLSMVHGFAEQCGGKLVLLSNPGQGTTAEICLPVATVAAEAVAAEGPAQPAPGAPEPLMILVVDDDPLVLTNTSAMLEDMGHKVIAVPSGREALRALRNVSPDLLLTDFAMPDMNGAELADAARTGWPDLPVLMVSGYADLPSGSANHLPKLAKPFREDQLANAVREATIERCGEGRTLHFPRC